MFKGRLNRRNYILILLGLFIFSILLSILSDMTDDFQDSSILSTLLIILSIPYILLVLSIHVRRFHDIGLSGLFTILIFVPLSSIVLGLIPGDKSDNKYGKISK